MGEFPLTRALGLEVLTHEEGRAFFYHQVSAQSLEALLAKAPTIYSHNIEGFAGYAWHHKQCETHKSHALLVGLRPIEKRDTAEGLLRAMLESVDKYDRMPHFDLIARVKKLLGEEG